MPREAKQQEGLLCTISKYIRQSCMELAGQCSMAEQNEAAQAGRAHLPARLAQHLNLHAAQGTLAGHASLR